MAGKPRTMLEETADDLYYKLRKYESIIRRAADRAGFSVKDEPFQKYLYIGFRCSVHGREKESAARMIYEIAYGILGETIETTFRDDDVRMNGSLESFAALSRRVGKFKRSIDRILPPKPQETGIIRRTG